MEDIYTTFILYLVTSHLLVRALFHVADHGFGNVVSELLEFLGDLLGGLGGALHPLLDDVLLVLLGDAAHGLLGQLAAALRHRGRRELLPHGGGRVGLPRGGRGRLGRAGAAHPALQVPGRPLHAQLAPLGGGRGRGTGPLQILRRSLDPLLPICRLHAPDLVKPPRVHVGPGGRPLALRHPHLLQLAAVG